LLGIMSYLGIRNTELFRYDDGHEISYLRRP
jgi:hypothetical protein